ncbi:hypothetical protein D3C84_592980 [compost metagenome]
MLRVLTGEPTDVLVPEEKPPVIGLLRVHRQGPGQAHGDGHGNCQRAVDQQFTPAFLPEHPGQGDQHRQQPGEKALGQEAHATGQAQCCPGNQASGAGGAVQRKPQGDQAQVDPESELRIEIGVAGLPGDHDETHVQQRAGKAFAWLVPQPASDQVTQHHTEPGTDGRSNPHPEQIVAKQCLAKGDHPVPGHRFFEIAQAHEMRRDPIAAQEHVLADLRVTGFIGNPQTVGAHWQQVAQQEKSQQQRKYPAFTHAPCTPSQPSRPSSVPRSTRPVGKVPGASGSHSPKG